MPTPLMQFVPDIRTILIVLPLALGYAAAAAAFAGWLRTGRGMRAPYTRKIFHFLILTVATLVHVQWDVSGVVVYGSAVTLLVIGAVMRGDGFAFYEALARPTDAPHRSLFIIVPLVTTALGGVLANLLFAEWAHIGYMAVALGDAVGEPVGTRWGRHRYRVPSIAGIAAERSLEGSASVFVATAAACGIVLIASGFETAAVIAGALAIGAATTAVEAVSHHGLDNLTIQVAAAAAAAIVLGA